MPPRRPPQVYAFLSYRAYLQAWFRARKAANPRFSHRLFARKAGVKSPSLLNEVIAGRRNLTPATQAGFIAAMGLSRPAAAFFADLVTLDQSGDEDERRAALERVSASRRFRSARPIEGATVDYLSSWVTPAVRELALCADFQADPGWVAARLTPRISRAKAREALDTLFALGLLEEDEGGRVLPTEVSLATPHEVADLVTHLYHQQMLDRVRSALVHVPAEERHVVGVTVSIPEDLVPRLKEEIDAFQERLLHLCDEHSDRAQRVYQINLQLVPLSRAPGGAA